MKDASVLDICHRHSTCSLLSSLCPLPPPPPPTPQKKKIKKSVKDASVLEIFRKHSRCSLLSSLCLPRPAPYPSACCFSTLTQEISQDYLKQGRRKRGPVRDCIACDPPKKDGQGCKRTGASYYCRELEGFVSCRLLGALPTPSSMTTPHPAP